MSEDQLCEKFANKLKSSVDFRTWVLMRTKFARLAETVRLLDEEQMSIRPRKRWWRHWWCNAPGLPKPGRETDIFTIFEAENEEQTRFAIHFENKKANYRFDDGQAEDYRPRATFMVGKPEFLNHSDFATVLLATERFKLRFAKECEVFDAFISYEEIESFIPEFGAQNS